jgi:tRNA threonylcarbamoyladenosine biosynthesis protein TsaB
MFLIAVDTSEPHGSIALAEGDRESFRSLEVVPLPPGSFSARLVPELAALLERHRVAKNMLGGLAAVSGPGSFTGLRVGLGTVKALAEALGKPIATVSSLEVLAWSAARKEEDKGRVLAIRDAGRKQFFAGQYEITAEKSPLRIAETLLDLEGLAACACASGMGLVVSPDQSVVDALEARGVRVRRVAALQADAVARLGLRKLLAGETVLPEALDANYVRRSDAELFSLPKLLS